MIVLAVCIGHPEILPGRRHKTGINKHPVVGSLSVDQGGLAADAICDRRYHGDLDQAVYVEGSRSLDLWSKELGRPLEYGELGENLVIKDIDNEAVAVGDRLVIGDVILEVTAPRMPCATLAAKMNDPQFVKRYRKAERPGFFCRVITPGEIRTGMKAKFIPYPGTRITMPDMMKDYGKTIAGEKLTTYLSAPIHGKLRTSLATGKVKF
jgi:MOSC domain-containing protein YiiM